VTILYSGDVSPLYWNKDLIFIWHLHCVLNFGVGGLKIILLSIGFKTFNFFGVCTLF
jgi:hypothetical protein